MTKNEHDARLDTLLVNSPVSSPLHPQLNLPLLKAHLTSHGYRARVLDANIAFFNEFLGDERPNLSTADCDSNPLLILSHYNELEQILWRKSQKFSGLSVGLRSLDMRHDRVRFDGVLAALDDKDGNPFIDFFERTMSRFPHEAAPKIVGIAITFQDQVIPAFTLASIVRRRMPQAVIVLGGQMITRCWDTLFSDERMRKLFDYLVLWDGEIPLIDIHRHVIGGETVSWVNVVPASGEPYRVVREAAAPAGRELPSPDFDDIDFSQYLFPEMLVPLQSTRGCYARCAFCAIPFGSNKYRVRDAMHIVDEIERIQDDTNRRFGRKATYFKFMEDTSAPSTLLHLAGEIRKRGLDVKWETFARLEKAFAEPGVLSELYAGGCRKIHWGLETNDPDILKDMNKKTTVSYTDTILRLAGEANILNFCFILIGFPGETKAQRKSLVDYIVANPHIHTLTVASFDLTRNSPMDEEYAPDNSFGLDRVAAKDFQVRLPYSIQGRNWKEEVVFAAHEALSEIVRRRPDIGFVTLFPDQIRAMFCDKYGNDWGRRFVAEFGEDNVRDMLTNIEGYIRDYRENREISLASLPEPLKREHLRTREDMAMLAEAILLRREYETRRIEQV